MSLGYIIENNTFILSHATTNCCKQPSAPQTLFAIMLSLSFVHTTLYIHSNHTLHSFKNEQIPGVKLSGTGTCTFLDSMVSLSFVQTTLYIHSNHTQHPFTPHSTSIHTTHSIHSHLTLYPFKNEQMPGAKLSVLGNCTFLDSMCYLHSFKPHTTSIQTTHYIHSNHTQHPLTPRSISIQKRADIRRKTHCT